MHIIIGHKNGSAKRERNLRFTIKYYRHYFKHAKILVIEQSTKTNLSNIKNIEYLHLPTKVNYYNRSLGFNEGYRKTKSDILFFTDNDFLIHPKIIKDLPRYIKKYEVFTPYNICQMLDEKETLEFIKKGPKHIPTGGRARSKKNTSKGGAVIVSRKAYAKIGGHDEDFRGWGGEDDIFFYMASQLSRYGRIEGNVKMFHLNHERPSVKKSINYKHNRDKVLLYRKWAQGKKLEHHKKLLKKLNKSPFPKAKVRFF